MEKLEETQVCTTVEQSERLLKLGLNKETADMVYVTDNNVEKKYRYYRIKVGCYIPAVDDGLYYIPAWSLHRLMEIMYKGDMFGFVGLTTHDRNIDTIYELVIANIEGLIKIDRFNQDYLEEKK